MNVKQFQKLAVVPALLAGLAVSGCATNSVQGARRVTGTNLLGLVGTYDAKYDEALGRDIALANAAASAPNRVAADLAKRVGCFDRGPLGDRWRVRDSWRRESGQQVVCTPEIMQQGPAVTTTASGATTLQP